MNTDINPVNLEIETGAPAQKKRNRNLKNMQLKENCFFDWQLNTIEYESLSGSRVIYLKNKEIDTTIIINSAQIMEQLEYFKN